MRALCFLISVIFSFSIRAAPAHPKAIAKKKDKLECTSNELKIRDCRLWSQGYTIQLLHGTVVWNDGTWHTVDPLPLKDQKAEWERVRFQFFGTHPILQLWFWGDGLGETKVQSLRWYVADAEKRKLTMLNEGVVRKRRLEPPKTEAAVKSSEKNPPKPKFLYDPWEKHGLKSVAKDGIELQLGDQKKLLSFEHRDQAVPTVEHESQSKTHPKKEESHHGI